MGVESTKKGKKYSFQTYIQIFSTSAIFTVTKFSNQHSHVQKSSTAYKIILHTTRLNTKMLQQLAEVHSLKAQHRLSWPAGQAPYIHLGVPRCASHLASMCLVCLTFGVPHCASCASHLACLTVPRVPHTWRASHLALLCLALFWPRFTKKNNQPPRVKHMLTILLN